MRCIVIDAEGLSSRSLARLLEKIKDIDIVSVARSGQEGQNAQDQGQADLLLVSTSVPDISRLKQSSENHLPQIIFVSNDRNFPDATYNYNVTDFLTQPVSVDRLRKTLDRARLRKRILEPSEPAQELFLRLETGLLRIKYDDIILLEKTDSGGCRMETASGPVMVDWGLRESLEKLNDNRFQKVNRDFVVNLTKVTGIFPTSMTIGDKTLSISRASRPMLEHMLKSI